jgi:serine O-acetyltransferase
MNATKDLSAWLFEDVAWYGPPSWNQVVRATLRYRTFRTVLTLRLCQAFPSGALHLVAMIVHHFAQNQAGVELPWEARIGPGFKLTHGRGVVVHPRAVIGRRVELMQGVTIGSMHYADSPVIGEYVRIGPNAIVLGDVTIGAGARIGGGCVITKDVEPNTLVVGAEPRRVLPFEAVGLPEDEDLWVPAKWWKLGSPDS